MKILKPVLVVLIFTSCASLTKNLEAMFANKDIIQRNPQPTSIQQKQKNDSTDSLWNIALLDTARNVDYLTTVEKDVILEMNKVRTNPKQYAQLYIEPMLKQFNGNILSYPGEIDILTQEGIRAVNDCVSALQKTKPVLLLHPSKGMSLAAKDHAVDQSKSGLTGHTGSDKSSPFDRMNRYGKWEKTAGENISYGDNTGRRIVVSLLVDDGVPNRGHRTNIMKSDFAVTGVSIQTHKVYRNSCTITYAGGYNEK